MIKESERLCVRERKIWGIGGVCVGFEDSRVSPKVDMIPYLLLVEHGLPYSIFIVFFFFFFLAFHDPPWLMVDFLNSDQRPFSIMMTHIIDF